MKRILLLFLVLLVGVYVIAQPPKGPADKGMVFGIATTADGALTTSELSTQLTINDSKQIKVKGKVAEVCKAEGCWLKMETANGPMMIKMKDHSFMVPLAMNGKTIVAQGVASFKETSVEMLKHYAEDAGKSKEEIAKITEPKKELSMQATGILVL